MTKSRRETDNARDTQYSIGHVPERILVRATMANQLVRATVANLLLRANQYEHACFGIYLPISPRFMSTSFYRDAGSALLHLVNQWLNFWYSRPVAFRYGNQNKKALLLRIELTNSALVDVRCTH